MLRVGLTGGIACGKSHVLRRLAAAGLHTLDLDRVAHESMTPGGSAYDEVLKAFGPGILAPDGRVDRKALGALVFADAGARARLNAIVHPKVRLQEARWVRARAGEPGAVLVTDAALLVESGVHLRFDRLVVVHCSEAEQLRRLAERDGIDEAAARARIAAQMPVSEKRLFAHFHVDTSGRIEATDLTADGLAATLRELATSRGPRVEVPGERVLGCLLQGPDRGPRGLSPVRLVSVIAEAGGLEMERVAACLEPAPTGPWYRSGRRDEPGPGPETLAGALVAWALARGAHDPEFLVAAAASLARLTHADPAAVAGACLFAVSLQDVVTSGGIPEDLAERVGGWAPLAERWGGAPSSLALAPVVRAALRHGSSVAAAREDCRLGGGEPALAAALVGAAAGVTEAQAPRSLVESLRSLSRTVS